jgi:hypothetical protein
MPFSERVNEAVSFFGTRSKVGRVLPIENISSTSRELLYEFLAVTESVDDDTQTLLRMMKEMGLIAPENVAANALYRMSPGGWLRFEELQKKLVQSSQAFVAMWFDQTMDEPYENGLQRAIYDSGYDPRRVDQQHHHLNKVDDEIIAEIRRSRFLVADFTCNPGQVRGGVYFEAGFAMGLNVPIIWTCRDTSKKDLHFDTRQYPHIVWKDSTDLYTQLTARIGALLGDGPKHRTKT